MIYKSIILVVFFVLAQVVGLAFINADISEISTVNGTTVIVHQPTSLGPRPEMTGFGTFGYVIAGVIIGTLLVLLIIRMKKINLWRAWFFLAVLLAIMLS